MKLICLFIFLTVASISPAQTVVVINPYVHAAVEIDADAQAYIDAVNAERAVQLEPALSADAERIINDCVNLLKGQPAPHTLIAGTPVNVWDGIELLTITHSSGNVGAGPTMFSVVGSNGLMTNGLAWDTALNGTNQAIKHAVSFSADPSVAEWGAILYCTDGTAELNLGGGMLVMPNTSTYFLGRFYGFYTGLIQDDWILQAGTWTGLNGGANQSGPLLHSDLQWCHIGSADQEENQGGSLSVTPDAGTATSVWLGERPFQGSNVAFSVYAYSVINDVSKTDLATASTIIKNTYDALAAL